MDNTLFSKYSHLKFYILLIGLSIPFWVLGAFAEELSKWLPMNLPASALMVVCPFIATLILVYKEEKYHGIKKLLKKSFDYKRINHKIWYIPSIFIMPLILLLSYWIMPLIGYPLPEPRITLLTTLVLFIVFFMTAIFEEVAWMGYLVEPMLKRWSALKTGIILGAIWALWHTIPYFQGYHNLTWIIWQNLFSIAARVLIVWLYNNNGKSIFIAILFHTMINVSDALFPINGSHYNPMVTGAITIGFVLVVTFLWGSKTLARFRYSKVL